MNEKSEDRVLKDNKNRHAEYYGMQAVFDELYKKSNEGKKFKHLMRTITSKDNILLAYRNIKRNKGSYTPSVDRTTIETIERISQDQLLRKIENRFNNYQPRKVRRKDIPKQNGQTRPLGIPSFWDRLVQQCILQVLEPICEAKFNTRSYGFRPNRSTEHAIADANFKINQTNLMYVVDVDIKGFFDEVNHVKLMRQLWTIGIQDKQLLVILRKILKAPIQLENGKVVNPTKGTPQGGLCEALHNPPYAKLSVMQSNIYIPYKYGLFIPFTLHNFRVLLLQKTKKPMSHRFYLSQDTSVISDRHPGKLRT